MESGEGEGSDHVGTYTKNNTTWSTCYGKKIKSIYLSISIYLYL